MVMSDYCCKARSKLRCERSPRLTEELSPVPFCGLHCCDAPASHQLGPEMFALPLSAVSCSLWEFKFLDEKRGKEEVISDDHGEVPK